MLLRLFRKNMLFLIIILYLVLELSGITNLFNHDELLTVNSIRDSRGLHYYDNAGPPLAYLSLYPSYLLFGFGEWQLRLVSVLFGVGTICLMWMTCRRYYSEKAALLSAVFLITTFTFFESSLTVYMDGTKLMFFISATIYAFLRVEESGSKKWMFLTGASFALGMMTKNLFLFIAPVLLIYAIVKRNRNLLKNLMLIAIITLAIYSVYPLTYYAAGKTCFEDNFVFPWSQTLSSLPSSEESCRYEYYCFSTRTNASLGHYLFGFSRALLFLTPLVFFMLFFAGRKKWINIFFMQALLYIIFIEVLISPLLDTSRYIIQLLPAVCILAGIAASELKFSKKNMIKLFALCAMFFIGFTALNLQKTDYLDIIHDKEEIKLKIQTLDVAFHSPVTLTIFPTTFYLSMASVVIVFSLGLLLAVLFAAKRKELILLLLLACVLGFNLFCLSEASLHLTTPNPEKARVEILSFIQNNEFKEPIYINSRFFGFYLSSRYEYLDLMYSFKQSGNTSISGGYPELNYIGSNSDDQAEIAALLERLEKSGGTILYFDQALLFKKTEQYETLSSCDIVKTFSDKGADIGYIFDCSKLKKV